MSTKAYDPFAEEEIEEYDDDDMAVEFLSDDDDMAVEFLSDEEDALELLTCDDEVSYSRHEHEGLCLFF